MPEKLFYVAYGSNLSRAALEHHLTDSPAPRAGWRPPQAVHRENHWLELEHRLWFGGRSRRWAGGVAFLDPRPGSGRSHGRAWAVSGAEFTLLVRRENGAPELGWGVAELAGVAVGDCGAVAVALSADGTGGKYDALLRLPDVAGAPAFTITTRRDLAPRRPDTAYRQTIADALAEHPDRPDAEAYLAAACR